MKRFLIAEYCDASFYMGWHLYLRENREFLKRNKNGNWGWIRKVRENLQIMSFLLSIGITVTGDGSCDYDGIAEIMRRYPIKGRRCGGKLRGCLEVNIRKNGEIEIANKPQTGS